MEKYLKYVPMGLLVLLVLRATILGASSPEAIICACILLYISAKENAKASEALAEAKKENTEQLKEIIEQSHRMDRDISEIRSYVSSIKMSQNLMVRK